jgi:putative isomerase
MKDLKTYFNLIRENLFNNYQGMFREAGGVFSYPFITPGSDQYADALWDWDCWLSDIALRQILLEKNDEEESVKALEYEKGCILNFLHWGGMDGWIPICVYRGDDIKERKPKNIYTNNMHKPVLAQHAAFVVKLCSGDAEWLRENFYFLQTFLNNYRNHHRHRCGLYYWQTDAAIGVDNDPCTYYRPAGSSGSIYLNCLMYKEVKAMVYLCDCLQLQEIGAHFEKDAQELRKAIQEHCWDERDGFYYSVDLNLHPVEELRKGQYTRMPLHAGQPREWDCLIQRIGVWSGFMAMWAGIATDAQAERMVKEHYLNPDTFNAAFGVRTLSKMEKMYNVRASGNPSSWLGPIWGISNYMTFRGLLSYGYKEEAKELAEKTVRLFGRDIERFGALHEYYLPDNGEPVLNRGFQNWNYLVLNMIAWLENNEVIEEF